MTTVSSSRLRWGILATGGIAHMFTSDLRTAGLDVRAVGSRSLESAQRFATQFDIPRAHGDYASLLADDDIDIVYIATPHPMHAENALDALAAGKHVLVEKPFTLTGEEAERVRVAAEEAGLLAMEAMWTRYLPHMMRTHELLAEGVLGEVRAVTADHTQFISTDPTHRLNALELGGGALLDLGIYPLSFAWDVLGAPVSLTASARLGETGADIDVATVASYANGALATTVSSAQGVGPNRAAIIGTDARIEIDPTWYNATGFTLTDRSGDVVETFHCPDVGRGMQYQALAAEQIIAEGRRDSDRLPIAETVAIMRQLDDIRAQIGVRYPSEH
ncbi:Gfo/Idh/MocA family oxidoreductase [Microbacterium neimengense]